MGTMVNATIQHGNTEQPSGWDIFEMNFEGSVHIQEGEYTVMASILDSDGNQSGGGAIASFVRLEDANRCYEKIMAINSNHEPEIHRMDWPNNDGEVIRSAETDRVTKDARKRAKIALDKARLV